MGPTHLLPMKTPLSQDILADWQVRHPPCNGAPWSPAFVGLRLAQLP